MINFTLSLNIQRELVLKPINKQNTSKKMRDSQVKYKLIFHQTLPSVRSAVVFKNTNYDVKALPFLPFQCAVIQKRFREAFGNLCIFGFNSRFKAQRAKSFFNFTQ